MKIKPLVEVFTPGVMLQYAEVCGWTLARAHARSGEPAKISGYLGKSDKFDKAIADFSVAYADQSERDHEVLMKAARSGRSRSSRTRVAGPQRTSLRAELLQPRGRRHRALHVASLAIV